MFTPLLIVLVHAHTQERHAPAAFGWSLKVKREFLEHRLYIVKLRVQLTTIKAQSCHYAFYHYCGCSTFAGLSINQVLFVIETIQVSFHSPSLGQYDCCKMRTGQVQGKSA